MRGRRLGAALALCAALAGPGVAQTAAPEQLTFTLPEARRLALQAAMGGQTRAALELAGGLLEENPRDGAAWLAMGTARLSMGDWQGASRAARKGFRFSDAAGHRYDSARVAALAAYAQERTLVTKFWLRRAGDVAPNAVARRRVEQQFRVVQAQSPWRYQFSFAASPSDNVNGGSESPFNIIEGLPIVGVVAPSARALSGVTVQTGVRLSYRLSGGEGHRTEARFSGVSRDVTLSEEARVLAPGLPSSQFDATSVGIGLSHAMKLSDRAMLSLDGDFKRYWQGTSGAFTSLSAGARYARVLSPSLRFDTGLSLERRRYETGGTGFLTSGNAGLSYAFANGNRLSGSLSVTEFDHPNPVLSSVGTQARLSLSLAEPIGPAHLQAALGYAHTDYANYAFLGFAVPGGRQDETLFFDVTATFRDLEWAGFSPNVTLRRQETKSNVSVFTSSSWAVSFGVTSNF